MHYIPDLTVRPRGLGSSLREVRGDELVAYALSSEKVVFQASGMGGKTALCKVLFSEILATSQVVPLMLDGREVRSAEEQTVEKLFWKAFERGYSPGMLEAFRQTDRSNRALLIDDWHKTELGPKGRQEFLEIAGRFFGRVFLFADEFFPLRELIEGAARTMLEFEHATVQQFRHAQRGKIIDRWVSLGQEHTAESGKITREIEEKETLVRGLIGKNILPSIPFVVLCILEAEQEGKAQSSEAGSFGYLYEVLVTAALNATKGPKAQLEKKYVFLSRLAYQMFKRELHNLSTDDVKEIATEYAKSVLVAVDVDSMLEDLVEARVLTNNSGNYSFAYNHFFYYFVARYYKDNLDREGGAALRQEIMEMADYLSLGKNSAVLMFVVYFCKDSAGIVRRLVENANAIYKEEAAANLDTDVKFFNEFCEQTEPEIPVEINLEQNRRERREFHDRIERNADRILNGPPRKYKYSADLSDKDKFELAHKHIELMGQVIRNFPGSLPGPEKLAILEACYSLGLRLVRSVLRIIESSAPVYRDALLKTRKDLKAATVEELRKKIDALIILLARISVLNAIKRVSGSVGLAELEPAYKETLNRVGKSAATQLIHLSIKLDHFVDFPESYIRELHRSLSGNALSSTVLSDLVVSHILTFDLDRKTRQSMTALFKIKQNLPQFVDPKRKR